MDQYSLKKIIEREFNAAGINFSARVEPHAVSANEVLSYQGECFIGGQKKFTFAMHARPPFELKISTVHFIEASKLARYIFLLEEILNEFHREFDDE